MHRPLSLALAAAALACSSPAPPKPPFPEGFLFGAAIAGFQVDMGCPTLPAAECDDPRSDWYAFATSSSSGMEDTKSYMSGHSPSQGPGHWELFREDHQRARQELNLNALRMSIEWSRLFPTPTDGVEGYEALKALADPKAVAHYHAMFASLKEQGLTPLVTLNHYTLPGWIHDAVGCHVDLDGCSPRGWLDQERTVREIAKYAGFAAREFGGEIDRWATLNEPFAVVLPGYLMPSAERANPPAVRLRFEAAKRSMVAMIEGHARMYDAIKANDLADADADGKTSEVGLVYAMAPAAPKNPDSKLDQRAAKNVFYLFNSVFLNAVIKGDLDAELKGEAAAVHREDLAGRMDYLGINYYTRPVVTGMGDPMFPTLSPLTTFDATNIELWNDYPRGIYEMAMVARDYGLPSIVTENGTVDGNDDGTGQSYLVRHVSWVKRALRDGADVRGYFWWTLMDNYEWNHGMNMRMGLYAVDKDDPLKQRTARKSVAVYSEICRAKDVPQALADQYPAPE